MLKEENFEIKLTEDFAYVDVNFKKALHNLCCEIDKFNTDFLSTATLLTKIPYELAMLVVSNLCYRKDDYNALINTLHYDEFLSDIKKREENKKTKFQNRLLVQKSMDYELFAMERLLTVGEIKNLIKLYIEVNKLKINLEEIVDGKVETEDKKLKVLIKAYTFLTKKANSKINSTLIKKMGKFWLDITLYDILRRKETKGLNV